MKRTTTASPAPSSAATPTKPRRRSALTALFAAAIALLLVLPAFASADTLGKVTEYTVPGGVPRFIVEGADGNLWYTNSNVPGTARRIGRITPAGEIEEFSEGLTQEFEGDLPLAIAAGPDGNVWFTDASFFGGPAAIGRVTPSGTIAKFDEEDGLESAANPFAIAAGPDGNVWFTDVGATKAIGKITPSGAITEFPLPVETQVPSGITAGPDGALWFGFKGSGEAGIGRITTSGTITEYTEGFAPNGSPGGAVASVQSSIGVTTGPDGNLWLIGGGSGGNNLIKFNPTTHAVVEYPTAGVLAGAHHSLAAAAGNLWFTNDEYTGLASSSTSGALTEFTAGLNEGSLPQGVTAGPGGNVWFTDRGSTRAIGKIGTEAPANPNLKLNVEEGSGTVVSNPAGLVCTGTAPHTCEAEVAEGKVTLTASPAPGYLVKSWKGCDVGGVNGRQCTVTATSSLKTVGVKFYKVFSLEGSKSGGLGIFGTAPGGINCGYACSSSTALYKEGSLTVKAKPAKNFHFVEFANGTGSAESCNGVTAESCTIPTFSSNSAIEEVYAENAKSTLSLAKQGGGQGFVKTKPTNINCGLTCTAAEASFYASESPEVTVTLGKGTTSVTWVSGAGTCTGNALTCTVPMSESHELVAKFN